MNESTKFARIAAAVLFSLIMGGLLAFGGLLAGMYLWGHFGPAPTDPDETGAYLCGLLFGGLAGLAGATTLLWKFWPRTVPDRNKLLDKY
jgi:hypothetical protein